MSDKIFKHTIAVLVDNEFGALARIVELFSARGHNIESLTVAVVDEEKNISRVTITTIATQKAVDLICKLLKRLVPVHNAVDLTKHGDYIERGMALVQIVAQQDKRDKAIEVAEKFRAIVVDMSEDSLVFEVAGTSEDIDEFIGLMKPLGVQSISRAGVAAGFKGKKRLIDIEDD